MVRLEVQKEDEPDTTKVKEITDFDSYSIRSRIEKDCREFNMKIGIIGVGAVGSANKKGFEYLGHEVLIPTHKT